MLSSTLIVPLSGSVKMPHTGVPVLTYEIECSLFLVNIGSSGWSTGYVLLVVLEVLLVVLV